MQQDSLESYFLSNYPLVDGSTENDPDEKPSREKMLVNAFIELANKLHAMFVQSYLFDSFYTFCKYHSTLRLYRSLLSIFIIPEVISESDMVSIDLKDPDFLTGFDSIFIEAMTKQYAMDSDITGTSEYKTFFREVKAFFIRGALSGLRQFLATEAI